MNLSEELIPKCWVCGKEWKRKETDKYCYFQGIVVCSSHKGAGKWYNAAISLASEKLKYERGEK